MSPEFLESFSALTSDAAIALEGSERTRNTKTLGGEKSDQSSMLLPSARASSAG